MRYLICFLLALPLTVPAQAPEQAPETTLRTSTSEVLLDVVVRDKHARIVRDLKPEEVQVFEDGVPQKVRHFEFFEGGSGLPVSSASAPAAVATPASPVAPQPPNVQELRDISVVSIVVANLDPRGRKLTLDTIHDFIKNELKPNTYVGVFTLGMEGLRKVQMYTNDAEKISAAMDRAVSMVFLARPKITAKSASSNDKDEEDTVPVPESNTPTGSQTAANAAQFGIAATLERMVQAQWIMESYDVYQGSMRYLMPLRTLVQSQAEIPGRKVVLLFSAGLPVHFDTAEIIKNVVSTANRSNVSVYAVDTRGYTQLSDMDNSRRMLAAAAAASKKQQMAALGGDQTVTPFEVMSPQIAEGAIHANTRGNLAELAEGTGGALLPASLDLRDPLRRVMEDVRTHYELSYSPSNPATDGSFRKIEVKVSRPGVTVFARNGYYALPMLNGRQIFPFEMATMRAINTRPLLKQFDFYASALQFRPGPDQTQLVFAFESPLRGLSIVKDKQWAKVHVCVTALVKNDQGQVIEKISKDIPYELPVARAAEMDLGVVTFTAPFMLPPGRYTMETAAVDRGSESLKASVRRSMLVVGQASGLSMSDVAVVRRVDAVQGPASASDPLQARGGKVTPELTDSVSRAAGGQVQFYAVGYPPVPVDAPVEVNLEIWRDGQVVLQTPASAVPPDASGAASILAGVPVEKLPSGQYEAQVSFQYKGQKVTKVTSFTVGSGS